MSTDDEDKTVTREEGRSMELLQYWHRAGRRRWILLLLPGLAAIASVPVALNQPPRYTATATFILQPNEAVPTAPSVNQVIADFQSLVESQPLRSRVARETGESAEALARDLEVKQIGAGNLAELTYASTRPRRATDVVRAAGSAAYDMLYGSRVAAAREQLTFARRYYDDVLAAKRTQASQGTSPLPDRDYEITSQALADVRVRRAEAQVSGQTAQARGLDRVIADLEQQLTRLGPQISSYDAASEDEQRASSVVDQAQQQLAVLQGLWGYRTSGAVMSSSEHALPPLRAQVETVARAVLLAVLLAAGILALAEVVRAVTRTEPAPVSGARTLSGASEANGAGGPRERVHAGPQAGLEGSRLHEREH